MGSGVTPAPVEVPWVACLSFVLRLLCVLKKGCVCGRRHPLFPLLALLFEKCEQSTLSSDCITSASFDVDIENFVRCQEKEGNPFFSEDPELDNLVGLWSVWCQIHNRRLFVSEEFLQNSNNRSSSHMKVLSWRSLLCDV